jgi:hypothetical protein
MTPIIQSFAARIRSPATAPLPAGVDVGRMAIYENLFRNNVQHFLDSGFPVLKSVLDEAIWQSIGDNFFASHRCETPYFLNIGQEFIVWFEAYAARRGDVPAFAYELAHYERVELLLDIAVEDVPDHGWSPLAWPLAYQWPVHRLSPDFQPTACGAPTLLLVWRDRQDKVRFQTLAPGAWHIAQALSQGQDIAAMLDAVTSSVGEQYRADVQTLLLQWQAQDILVLDNKPIN